MLENININIFQALNAYAGQNSIVDCLAIIMAKYLPLLFIVWLLYLWFRGNKQRKNYALFAGYSAVIGLLINFIIATFYFHPRPFMVDLGRLLIPHKPETSFPSDHTTFMLSIAFMLSYFKETRKSGLVLSVLGLLGGLARVFSGLHFPLDIAGSFIVSLFASTLVWFFKNKLSLVNAYIISLYSKITTKSAKC